MVHSWHMPHRWRLKEFLAENDITPYRLARELSGKLSQNSVYNLSHEPKFIKIETFDVLIPALRDLTNKNVTINDLLVWEET